MKKKSHIEKNNQHHKSSKIDKKSELNDKGKKSVV